MMDDEDMLREVISELIKKGGNDKGIETFKKMVFDELKKKGVTKKFDRHDIADILRDLAWTP